MSETLTHVVEVELKNGVQLVIRTFLKENFSQRGEIENGDYFFLREREKKKKKKKEKGSSHMNLLYYESTYYSLFIYFFFNMSNSHICV